MLRKITEYRFLVILALALGLAPFLPRPHLVEKLQMLFSGQLTRPMDIFDLFFHGSPTLLLLAKAGRDLFRSLRNTPGQVEGGKSG